MSDTADTAHPSKRSRMSDEANDVVVVSRGKKARGRPRVDTQDATAADRRRTQIRLAQRAYRQRKETTISSLRQQSSQLHAIIDEMNKAFMRFNDNAVQSGLLLMNHELAAQLKQVTATFSNCVKAANEQTLDSDEEELNETGLMQGIQGSTAPAAAPSIQPSRAIESPVKEQSWGYAATSHISERSRQRVDVQQSQNYYSHISSSSYNLPEPNNESHLVRRQFPVSEVLDQSSLMNPSYQPHLATDDQSEAKQQQQEQSLPFGLVDIPSREQSPFVPPYIFPVNVPAMNAELPPALHQSLKATIVQPFKSGLNTKTLSPTFTYSYEEISFARRLTRATLETAFLVLSTYNAQNPALLATKFKLSLPFLTFDEIRERIKVVLSRGVNEDLDWYATPFLHLGGAGTHYQRRDAYGKAVPLRNTWTVCQIGPLERRMVRLENITDGQVQDFEDVDLSEFEGEWFDAHDVQGYIEEQWHCRIDPKSSFAECLIENENSFSDMDAGSPSLSHGSTTSSKDFSVSTPVSHGYNAFEPLYGIETMFNNTSPPNFPTAPPKQSMPDLSFDQTLGLDLAPSFDIGLTGNGGYSALGLNIIGESEQLAVVRQEAKKVAWVDVSKLVEKIIKNSVCIGRSPGYRRKDIDAAFREALIPTY